MNKASTYLFAIMSAANVVVALFISHTVRFMMLTYNSFGAGLPDITTHLVRFHGWPLVFVAIGVAGVVISLFSKIQSSLLSHALCIILILEVLLLVITVSGLYVPFYIPEPRLIQ